MEDAARLFILPGKRPCNIDAAPPACSQRLEQLSLAPDELLGINGNQLTSIL